jgi:signal transduction histidine kinase
MHKNVKNLLKLLTNLLDWARMQQGTISYEPIDLVLSEVVSQNINLISKSGEQKGIEIIFDVPNNQIVYADQEMLNSILGNLLSNAVKFTSKGGKVRVSSKETKNNTIEIAVQDNGVGMPECLSKKLFRMEEHVGRKGTEGEESTGIGLLLCKEFVEKHGGKIWVETKENEGSTFYFTLPKVGLA